MWVIAEREWTEKLLKHARARSIIARLHGRQIGLQNLSRLLVHHGHGLHPCPLCDEQGLSLQVLYTVATVLKSK